MLPSKLNLLLLTALIYSESLQHVKLCETTNIFPYFSKFAFCHSNLWDSQFYEDLHSSLQPFQSCTSVFLWKTFKKFAEISIFGLFWINKVSGITLCTWLMRYSCINIECGRKKETKSANSYKLQKQSQCLTTVLC